MDALFLYVPEKGLERTSSAVVFWTYRSAKGVFKLKPWGLAKVLLIFIFPEHNTMPGLQQELNRCYEQKMNSVLCPLQNQVVIAAGKSSLGARLSGALHIYNLGQD